MAVKKTTEAPGTEVEVTTTPTNTGMTLPEGMSAEQAELIRAKAMQNVGSEGLIVPRMKLLQAISKEVQDEIAPIGHWLNSVSLEDYGTELYVTPLVPVHMRMRLEVGSGLKCRAVEDKPNPMQGVGDPGILCAKCEYAKWGDDNTPPDCNESYQYFVLLVDEEGELLEPMPVAVSFMSTSFKEAKKWNTLMTMTAKGVMPWNLVFKISVEKMQSKKGTYSSPRISMVKGVYTSETTQSVAWDLVPRLSEVSKVQMAGDDGSGSSTSVDVEAETEDDLPY
jgi:hypothetical protein